MQKYSYNGRPIENHIWPINGMYTNTNIKMFLLSGTFLISINQEI